MLYRENGQFKTTYRADQQMLPILQDRFFVVALVAAAFLVVPLIASDYWFRALIVPFLILSIAAIGLNILVGYCGQISLGQAAFMSVGAYAAFNFTVRVPELNTMPASAEIVPASSSTSRKFSSGTRTVKLKAA